MKVEELYESSKLNDRVGGLPYQWVCNLSGVAIICRSAPHPIYQKLQRIFLGIRWEKY